MWAKLMVQQGRFWGWDAGSVGGVAGSEGVVYGEFEEGGGGCVVH